MLNLKLTHKTARTSVIVLFVIFCMLVLIKPSFTFPKYMQAARAQGYPASNCSYCHLSVSGAQGWNERGLWLREQKKKHQADEVNVAWLKDYRPSESKNTPGTTKVDAKAAPEPTKTKNSGTTEVNGKTKTQKLKSTS